MDKMDYKGEIEELKKQFGDLKKEVSQPTAHQKANSRYEKRQNRFLLRIPQHEIELWDHLREQPNKNQYLKSLIARDIGYKNWDHFKGIVPSEEYRKEWDEDKRNKKIRSKLLQLETWKQFEEYLENNNFSVEEWKQIENILCLDENPADYTLDLFNLGILPKKAWTKKTISYKVNDIIKDAPFDVDIDWDKYDEETLQRELLKKSSVGNPDSKLNKNLEMFKLDREAIVKFFNIDYKI